MVKIILNQPQMGENIGAAARAMMNFNIGELRLVAPRDGWPNEKAIAMAAGAFDVMPPVQVFQTLDDAIADLHFTLATTARPRDMVKSVYTPSGAATEIHSRQSNGQDIGLIFGAERSGLSNEDISHMNGIITIPTNPDFPALNLGQSVLLMAYEISKHMSSSPNQTLHTGESPPAKIEETSKFITRLETELESSEQFFRSPELMPTMKRNIRNIFLRDDLTQQEVRTLHGILSALITKRG